MTTYTSKIELTTKDAIEKVALWRSVETPTEDSVQHYKLEDAIIKATNVKANQTVTGTLTWMDESSYWTMVIKYPDHEKIYFLASESLDISYVPYLGFNINSDDNDKGETLHITVNRDGGEVVGQATVGFNDGSHWHGGVWGGSGTGLMVDKDTMGWINAGIKLIKQLAKLALK